MSANDKAAATYGRETSATEKIEGILAVHRENNSLGRYCLNCPWRYDANSTVPPDRQFRTHQAEMLEPLIVGREHEASRQALNDAADQLEPGTPGNTYLYELADEIDLDMGAGYTGGDDQTATNAAAAWIRSRVEQ